MPIYAYKCLSCGKAQDVLRKISDAPLTVCPSCGKETFAKQLTAPGFQLKGSGWYATDFKGGKPPAPTATGAKEDGKTDVKSDVKTDGKTASEPAKTEAKPAATASAAPASAAGPGGNPASS
jgi:putative FmdB family regulatory protein